MPNWCDNTLTVKGPKEELKMFKDLAIKNDVFKMDGLFPTPTELLDTKSPNTYMGNDKKAKKKHEEHVRYLVEKYGHPDWYDWRIANWGTKWDVSEDSQSVSIFSEEEIMIWFTTAWDPPIEFVSKVAIDFPNLRFEMYYMEEGNGLCGLFTACGYDTSREDVDIEYHDEDGEPVETDGERWYYVKSKEVIEDEDFYGTPVNPLQ